MARCNLIGKTILGYTVEEQLGSGTFGTVYRVVKRNQAGEYTRALKHITIPTDKEYVSVLNSMGGDVSKADHYFEEMLRQIVSEIQILNALSEDGAAHIVRYYENDIIVHDSPRRYDVFILMEYLTPLDEFIGRTQNFCVRDVIRLGLDVLAGLQLCYENGIIHRDIKDDNIFVSKRMEYKIGDFGVSKLLKGSSRAESRKGTPNYLAPEVYLGREGYNQSVDLYSLGIVLYRLLNHTRGPFLPPFPAQYFAQDEEQAFQRRMSGEIPPLPQMGGQAVGETVVRAISGSGERFSNAGEFADALRRAAQSTPDEVMEQRVTLEVVQRENTLSDRSESEQEYKQTLGASLPSAVPEELYGSTQNDSASIHRHLFESLGERPSVREPVVQSVPERDNGTEENVVPNAALPPREPEPPPAIEPNARKWLFFLAPVVLLMAGIVMYFVVAPRIYGGVVSFVDWLVGDPRTIAATLRDPEAVLPQINRILAMRVFWWVWLAAWIVSLFLLGRTLQAKPATKATDAVLVGKEPYVKVQQIQQRLKQMDQSGMEWSALLYTVTRLKERLEVERDFGFGNAAVTRCENEIAGQLQFLLRAEPSEGTQAMSQAVEKIQFLLTQREQLMRR